MRFLLKHLETRTNVIILEVGGYAPAPSTLLEIMVFFILQRELCKDFVNIVLVKNCIQFLKRQWHLFVINWLLLRYKTQPLI